MSSVNEVNNDTFCRHFTNILLSWSKGGFYQPSASSSSVQQDSLKPTFTVANLPGTTNSAQSTVSTTSTAMQVTSGPSFPITNYLAPVLTGSNVSANGTVLKTAGTSTGVMQLPGGFTFMPGMREI